MKITHRLVAEVKRHNNLNWHDKAWRDFQGLPEVEAVNHALMTLGSYDTTTKDIIAESNCYLARLAEQTK